MELFINRDNNDIVYCIGDEYYPFSLAGHGDLRSEQYILETPFMSISHEEALDWELTPITPEQYNEEFNAGI